MKTDTPQTMRHVQVFDQQPLQETLYLLRFEGETGTFNVISPSVMSAEDVRMTVEETIRYVKETDPNYTMDDVMRELVGQGFEFFPKTNLTFEI